MQQKISFVINSLAGGGAERVLTTLLTHSRAYADRYAIELVLLDDEEDRYTLPDWLTVVRLGGKGGLRESIAKLRAHFDRSRPDVALSFLTRANVCTAIAMKRLRRPAVLSERIHTTTHLGNGLGGRIAKFMVRRYYPIAQKILCVSGGVGDDLVANFGIAPDKIRVIHNPFDLDGIRAAAETAADLPTTRPFAVAMGRLVDAKNFAFLIRAYSEAGIEQDLVIAGEGPLRDDLARLIDELGLTGRVHLPGFQSNPYALMRAADFYILSSNAEGFPNGLVEAMAVGLPVVATDCPSGPSEILEAQSRPGAVIDAPHGLLVPTNDVEAMRDALRRLASPDVRGPLAAAAKARADQFAVAPTVERYWNELLPLIGS